MSDRQQELIFGILSALYLSAPIPIVRYGVDHELWGMGGLPFTEVVNVVLVTWLIFNAVLSLYACCIYNLWKHR